MDLSSCASATLQQIAAAYAEKGRPGRHNIAWHADSDEEEAAHRELQAAGILEGHTVSNRRLTEFGLELVTQNDFRAV